MKLSDIIDSEKLNSTEKVFLIKIHMLSSKGKCFATNSYFSSVFNISERQVSNVITSLEKKGFIITHYIDKGKKSEKREIYVKDNIFKSDKEHYTPKNNYNKSKVVNLNEYQCDDNYFDN